MKKEGNRKIMLIVLIIGAVAVLYVISANASNNNSSQVSHLKDENLQLISASWNESLFQEFFRMNPSYYKYGYDENLKIYCNSPNNILGPIDMKFSLSLPSDFDRKSFSEFICKVYVNGKDTFLEANEFYNFKDEGTYSLTPYSSGEGGPFIKKNNQVTLCCDTYSLRNEFKMQQKVCKSLTVPPLCT